jgi:hypothetical protein
MMGVVLSSLISGPEGCIVRVAPRLKLRLLSSAVVAQRHREGVEVSTWLIPESEVTVLLGLAHTAATSSMN